MGTTERRLLGWMDVHVKPGETWLDVGAHYGYTALALSIGVGPKGRVFAFEPVVASAGSIAQTRALNKMDQMTVVPIALSNNPSLELHRSASVRGMADMTVRGPASESFLSASFDWLWPQLSKGQPRIDGVKIDVQGAELAVLKGMMDSLTRWVPKLVIEFHAGVSREEVLSVLTKIGYGPQAFPIEHSSDDSDDGILDDRSYSFSPERRERPA